MAVSVLAQGPYSDGANSPGDGSGWGTRADWGTVHCNQVRARTGPGAGSYPFMSSASIWSVPFDPPSLGWTW